MMINHSGLEPLGHAVLLRMKEIQAKSGIIAIPESVRERSSALEQMAEVIDIGNECWHDEVQARCKVGDTVYVTKLAGWVTRGPADGELYRLVNDRDIFCRVGAEVANG